MILELENHKKSFCCTPKYAKNLLIKLTSLVFGKTPTNENFSDPKIGSRGLKTTLKGPKTAHKVKKSILKHFHFFRFLTPKSALEASKRL